MKVKVYSKVFGEDIEFELPDTVVEDALHEKERVELLAEPNPEAVDSEHARLIIEEAYR